MPDMVVLGVVDLVLPPTFHFPGVPGRHSLPKRVSGSPWPRSFRLLRGSSDWPVDISFRWILPCNWCVVGFVLCFWCGDFGCVGFTLLSLCILRKHVAHGDGCGCVGITRLHHASYV